MTLLVVGSVALDTVETPFGAVKDVLGGSATYFSLAASTFTGVNLVAVVGTDFRAQYVELLKGAGIDLTGLQISDGRTFRWAGRYDYDLNTAHTLNTELNVFSSFHPVLPESYLDSELVFLANIDPELQAEVLRQARGARLTVLDTMNFWIQGKRGALTETMSAVDVVLMNEAEARQYAGTYNLMRAAREILAVGPRILIVKKGEYGCVMFSDSTYFVAPAYPLENVRDPTGAGDSFAGGFMGYLAYLRDFSLPSIRKAIVYGSVVASFAVEDFSVNRLVSLTPQEIAARYREFQEFTCFEQATG